MDRQQVITVVGSRLLVPERADEFHRWYNEHIRMWLETPGVIRARRYERIPVPGEVAAPEYLALYTYANEVSICASEASPARQWIREHRIATWGQTQPFDVDLLGGYRPLPEP